nr:HEPN domain-containing protein [Candidatus Freyrarchaeum guaymaensis]
MNVEALLQAAKTLDKYYVPTRYPNAWVEGAPEDYYTREDAGNAIKHADDH